MSRCCLRGNFQRPLAAGAEDSERQRESNAVQDRKCRGRGLPATLHDERRAEPGQGDRSEGHNNCECAHEARIDRAHERPMSVRSSLRRWKNAPNDPASTATTEIA